jgi:hypothetical protein
LPRLPNLVVALILLPGISLAQPLHPDPDGCVDTMIAGTPTIEGFVSKNGTACPPGTWVQKGQSVNVDFRTESAGSCQVYKKIGTPPACGLYATQTRGIGLSRVVLGGTGGWTAVYPDPNNGLMASSIKCRASMES